MKGCGFNRELEEPEKLEMSLAGNQSIDVMRRKEEQFELNSESQCVCVTTLGTYEDLKLSFFKFFIF